MVKILSVEKIEGADDSEKIKLSVAQINLHQEEIKTQFFRFFGNQLH
jgi:hypothetical protein